MQELAIHLEHYKRSAVGHLQDENQREADSYTNGVDLTKAHLDYFVGDKCEGRYSKKIDEYLIGAGARREERKAKGNHGGRPRKVMVYGDNGKTIRADANVLSSLVVTISRETAEQWGAVKVRNYFEACNDYLLSKYANKVDAVVHQDEPEAGIHMHYNFVPIKDGHLNSDGLFKRQDLRQLHTELAEYLQSRGFEVERGIEGGKKKYKRTIAELKREQERLAKIGAPGHEELERILNRSRYVKAESKLFGKDIEEHVELSLKDANRLLALARVGVASALTLAEANTDKERLKAYKERAEKAEKEVLDLGVRVDTLTTDNERLKADFKARIDTAVKEAEKVGAMKFEEEHRQELKNGRLLAKVVYHSDLVDEVNRIIKEADSRSTLRDKKQQTKTKTKANTKDHGNSR